MNKYQEALDDVSILVYGQNSYYSSHQKRSIDILQELVDKEIPMKPNYDKFYGTNDGFFEKYYCSKCRHEKVFVNRFKDKYCPNCGQKLDWSK